jgi:antitoxin component YwqK of YwqJK toxin-antitoxin module
MITIKKYTDKYKNKIVEEYNENEKLAKRTWYHDDNGTIETIIEYNPDKMIETITEYNFDGTIKERD